MKYHSIISSTIGSTPLVRLNRINEDIDAQIYAKLEFFNPLGSVKDRIAASMIETACKYQKPVRIGRCEVFLGQQLESVSQRLQPSESATRSRGPQAVLYAA